MTQWKREYFACLLKRISVYRRDFQLNLRWAATSSAWNANEALQASSVYGMYMWRVQEFWLSEPINVEKKLSLCYIECQCLMEALALPDHVLWLFSLLFLVIYTDDSVIRLFFFFFWQRYRKTVLTNSLIRCCTPNYFLSYVYKKIKVWWFAVRSSRTLGTSRNQYIIFKQASSYLLSIVSGVTQGSVLGPLFLLYLHKWHCSQTLC